jgi:hypothetical protein
MARRRKRGLLVARMHRQAQLKVRLPESLRFELERAADKADHSMNAEIVRRLHESIYGGQDPAGMAAEAILNGLDQEIVTRIEDAILRANAEEEVRELYRKEAKKDLTSGPVDVDLGLAPGLERDKPRPFDDLAVPPRKTANRGRT